MLGTLMCHTTGITMIQVANHGASRGFCDDWRTPPMSEQRWRLRTMSMKFLLTAACTSRLRYINRLAL